MWPMHDSFHPNTRGTGSRPLRVPFAVYVLMQWLFWSQVLNMLVFGMHMRYIKKTVNALTLSLRTREMLNDVLGRFTNFCVNYAIFMLSTFMLMVLAIVDVVGAWSSNCDRAFQTAYYLYASARFYCFLRAVYIFSYVSSRVRICVSDYYKTSQYGGMASNSD